MLTTAQLLQPLAERRTDEVVVTTMSTVRPWGYLSDSDLDFASADSAMGHAADLALGLALARPERRVICINGDGSMLMCLGTLATAVEAGAHNYVLVVCDNGEYEITGHQPVAAAGRIDYAAMAEAAGFRNVFQVDEPRQWAEIVGQVLELPGPTFVHVLVEAGQEGPIGRSAREPARYLHHSLADWSRILRAALTGPKA
ncbi:MAG: thiamine pyrophosphate-dependent enzyme [Gemmatimonadota bacterium]|nr:thiamine pyrophosphate-dependent enzyme [Gemmatimonadota bacterium]MDH3423772.1 thiamine pyrophosphate-dependent enzyme [Gemmatimonadota bacterium]